MNDFPRGFFVRRGERRLFEDRVAPAWAVDLLAVLLLIGAVLVAVAITTIRLAQDPHRAHDEALVWILATAYAGLCLVYVWRRMATTEYILTDEAVYSRHGQLMIALSTCSLDRITDLHVRTSVIGRIMGFSGLDIRTAGGSVTMPGLRDAYGVRSRIHEARHAFLARLLREGGREAPTASTYCQCPTCGTAFPVEARRPLDVTCPQCGETGTLFAEAST